MYFIIPTFCMQVYTNLAGNHCHVVNTGWAMLALIDADQVIIQIRLNSHSVDEMSSIKETNL